MTHDPEEALQIADQIILMHQGQIIQIGSPKQLYLQPKTLFAARYFSSLNEIPTRIKQQNSHCIWQDRFTRTYHRYKIHWSAASPASITYQPNTK